jgi:transposase
MHSWAFHDLKSKISYKAQRAGVMVIEVDPRNTSRMCSVCGYIHRSNRPTQDKFSCRSCGFAAHADYNAALNIRRRASVNAPYADSVLGTIPA